MSSGWCSRQPREDQNSESLKMSCCSVTIINRGASPRRTPQRRRSRGPPAPRRSGVARRWRASQSYRGASPRRTPQRRRSRGPRPASASAKATADAPKRLRREGGPQSYRLCRISRRTRTDFSSFSRCRFNNRRCTVSSSREARSLKPNASSRSGAILPAAARKCMADGDSEDPPDGAQSRHSRT